MCVCCVDIEAGVWIKAIDSAKTMEKGKQDEETQSNDDILIKVRDYVRCGFEVYIERVITNFPMNRIALLAICCVWRVFNASFAYIAHAASTALME